MRTIETKVYQYDELLEEAQSKAVEAHLDINVNYDWWEFIYEDLEKMGIEVVNFNSHKTAINLTETPLDVVDRLTEEYADITEIHQTALNFKNDWVNLHHTSADTDVSDDEEDLELDFTNTLVEDVRIMLNHEYEYLTSEEAIIETLVANEYEFTKDGTIFNIITGPEVES